MNGRRAGTGLRTESTWLTPLTRNPGPSNPCIAEGRVPMSSTGYRASSPRQHSVTVWHSLGVARFPTVCREAGKEGNSILRSVADDDLITKCALYQNLRHVVPTSAPGQCSTPGSQSGSDSSALICRLRNSIPKCKTKVLLHSLSCWSNSQKESSQSSGPENPTPLRHRVAWQRARSVVRGQPKSHAGSRHTGCSRNQLPPEAPLLTQLPPSVSLRYAIPVCVLLRGDGTTDYFSAHLKFLLSCL